MHCMESSSGFMKLRALDMAMKTSSFTRSGTPCRDKRNKSDAHVPPRKKG